MGLMTMFNPIDSFQKHMKEIEDRGIKKSDEHARFMLAMEAMKADSLAEAVRSLNPKANKKPKNNNSRIKDNEYILKRIIDQNKTEVPRRDLYQLVSHRFNSDELEKVLIEFEKRGYIQQIKRGRKRIILINIDSIEGDNDVSAS